ncbi:MAG TPA: FprA family A-type flavoprotein [Candidatus Eremiobacteraeota bacterium]|nr:MAG: Nitric oxide reductase [bacterium ADurb.Bin363]HPZ10245.1 FprA family A-type flavoprotein [Candidatus Eremiobacteraeota bacterium]
MKALEIKPDIYWVGAIDWSIRDFHGYVIPDGTTYNSYLILDEEITLLDTVKADFEDTELSNISSLIEPSKIKNVIVNHIENDHMGALRRIMNLVPEAIIYITEKGKHGMSRFFDISRWNIKTVKTGQELKTGKYTLGFIETPMLHWPDSMVTYVKEAKLLISQDAFGQHLASTARFDDEFIKCASESELEDFVIDYYANILMPFGKIIKAKIAEIQKSGISVDMIAPAHGIIWRTNPGKVMEMYLNMADGKSNLRVAIIYDTMWRGTEFMIQPVMQGIKDEGVDCKIIKLRATPMSAAIKELWKSRGCLIGSPTLNNEVYPSVGEFIIHLRGLRPADRIMGAFGCYGWGGGAVKWLYNEFKGMKLESFGSGLEINYRPLQEDDKKCYEFGRDFARKVKEFHKKYE